ncbi:MAG TPA: FprA family A-type flavoprotein [Lachnospiraceae bacterium]|nr:FprA family A-type flavoprotein [Lachnospiraceae bacterium]
MDVLKIAEGTYQLSVNVEHILFEGVWEMPQGVSLNSYVICGEKTAIVDGFCGWDNVPETLFALLEDMKVNAETIEYLIINHMEPDHSGWIEEYRKINPTVQILCSAKAKNLLETFYNFGDHVLCVGDGDSVDLGDGHVIRFTSIPNVHWPDTMASFDELTGVLFTCDAFGGFGKLTDKKFAEQLSSEQLQEYETETIRYYSNVLGSFTSAVKKSITKCREFPLKMIAPGHGLMWNNPEMIMNQYNDYADYQKGPARCEITFIWSSMYGMTEKAVRYVEKILKKEDIKVHIHQVPNDSWGSILTSAWTSTGIILAMPTYEFKMFPPMAAVLEELGKKKVMNRKAFRFGSFGWSGGAQRELDDIMTRLGMNWDFLEPVEFAGCPKEEDLEKIAKQVEHLIREIKTMVK